MKCDESKPYCRNCTILGRICGGYPYVGVSCSSLVLSRQPTRIVGPPEIGCRHQERRMFDYLGTLKVHHVAGSFDADFWRVDIMRATQVSPAIWHASLALAAASARRRILASSTGDKASPGGLDRAHEYHSFALHHHNQSIRHLVDITRHGLRANLTLKDQETLLLANILFTSICELQDDSRQAAVHALHNSRLFSMWKFWEHGKGSMLDSRSLVAVVMLVEYLLIGRLRRKKIPPWFGHGSMDQLALRSQPFQSARAAYLEFQPLFLQLLMAFETTGPSDPYEYSNCAARIQMWKARFDEFVEGHAQASFEDISVLSAMHTATQICVHIDLLRRLVIFEEPDFLVEKLTSTLERLVEHQKAGGKRGEESGEPTFSHAIAVGSVFWTAIRTRRSDLRERLIRLLREWPRREGLWDCKVLAGLCEATIHRKRQPGTLSAFRSWVDWVGPCEDEHDCVYALIAREDGDARHEMPPPSDRIDQVGFGAADCKGVWLDTGPGLLL